MTLLLELAGLYHHDTSHCNEFHVRGSTDRPNLLIYGGMLLQLHIMRTFRILETIIWLHVIRRYEQQSKKHMMGSISS